MAGLDILVSSPPSALGSREEPRRQWGRVPRGMSSCSTFGQPWELRSQSITLGVHNGVCETSGKTETPDR